MNHKYYKTSFYGVGLILATSVHAGIPVWTYSAPNPASVTVSANSMATVQYTVTNQSQKSQNLILKPTAGLSASPCYLAQKGSTCALTITVNGSGVPLKGIHAGPTLCKEGSLNQCYQPAAANQLNITRVTTPPPQPTQYLNIYTQTNNYRVMYSFNNGSTWNPMINQQSSWFWNNNTSWFPNGYSASMVIDTQGVMYQALESWNEGSFGQLIYSQDGTIWNLMNVAFPSGDSFDSSTVIASGLNNLYVGTANGYIVSTSDQGSTWNTSLNQGNYIDEFGISAIFIDSTGTLYVGGGAGAVYYSTDQGDTWNQTATSPSSVTITSLAATSMNSQATWYASASDGSSSDSYYSADQGQTWTQMSITWPASDAGDSITTLSVFNNVLYAGTQNGYVFTLRSSGTGTWDAAQQSASVDGSAIRVLAVTQGGSLSPLFVEGTLGTRASPQALPVNNGTATLMVTNYSSSTATNVHIQTLPAGVTQTPGAGCASVAANRTCTITLSATQPFSPYNAAIIGSNSANPIEHVALVSSLNGYLVYNVNTSTGVAYVVDSVDANSSAPWSPTDNNLGISEISSSPSSCNGATDGYCNTGVILAQGYSGSYAAEACASRNSSSSFPGATFTPNWWYLPSVCELGAGLTPDSSGNTYLSCNGVSTGIYSLYGLGYLSDLNGYYWSSTEWALSPQGSAQSRSFPLQVGTGSYKSTMLGVRCVQGVAY
jgi:photosystem II stability/assembly factor-like uncharacterized protein